MDFVKQLHGMHKTIVWVNLALPGTGGFRYGALVREVLASVFRIEVKDLSLSTLKFRPIKPIFWLLGLVKLWFEKPRDLWVRNDIISMLVPPWTRKKNMLLIYHIDPAFWPRWQRIAYRFLEGYLYGNVRKADAVVTISSYWEQHFKDRGCKNVYKVYMGFPVEEYRVSEQEVEQFKKTYGLEGKPIVYLGMRQPGKGVVEAYDALKDLSVYFATSGKELVHIPARNFNNVDKRIYLCLLKASAVAVCMTRFKAGWEIVPHEAMLMKTPVIGSGLGGMRELLEGGGQTVCEDFHSLKEKVQHLLDNPQERRIQGERGYEFAKTFTIERFEKEWREIISKVLSP